jgi:hypothetical protein
MKLSKLRSLCDKAIEKYGDMYVGTYDKDYAYDVAKEEDLHGLLLRVISKGSVLPGVDLDEEYDNEEPVGYFACVFYAD